MFLSRAYWACIVVLGAMGCDGVSGTEFHDPAPRRVTPLRVEPTEAWALFDRDVTTRWTPSTGSRTVRVELDAPIDVAALKVHGEGAVSIRGIDAEALLEVHASSPDAWATRTASR